MRLLYHENNCRARIYFRRTACHSQLCSPVSFRYRKQLPSNNSLLLRFSQEVGFSDRLQIGFAIWCGLMRTFLFARRKNKPRLRTGGACNRPFHLAVYTAQISIIYYLLSIIYYLTFSLHCIKIILGIVGGSLEAPMNVFVCSSKI